MGTAIGLERRSPVLYLGSLAPRSPACQQRAKEGPSEWPASMEIFEENEARNTRKSHFFSRLPDYWGDVQQEVNKK